MSDALYPPSDYALDVSPADGRQWRWTVLHKGSPAASGGAGNEGAARRNGLVCAATLSALRRGAARRP